jgi:carbamate kinase
MLTKTDAEKGNRIVWRSPDTGEVRYGTITEIIDDVEVVIAYDDGGMACAYVGNTFSNVRPA